MSMTDYDKAEEIIDQNTDKSDFAGPRSEELVRTAENALGVSFPPTYRRFVLDHGAGNFGWAEFYGVISDNFLNSSVPDGIWSTLTQRQRANLPGELVVIGNTGGGEFYCLDLSEKDGPVVVVDPGAIVSSRERVAPDFGAFFLQLVQQVAGQKSD